MATHSSVLCLENPVDREPGGLQSVGSQRVGHDQSDLACTHKGGCSQCPFSFFKSLWMRGKKKKGDIASKKMNAETGTKHLTLSPQFAYNPLS